MDRANSSPAHAQLALCWAWSLYYSVRAVLRFFNLGLFNIYGPGLDSVIKSSKPKLYMGSNTKNFA